MPVMALRRRCAPRTIGTPALLALVAGAALSCAASAQVHWRSGADGAIPEMNALAIAETIDAVGLRAADSGDRRVVVQFKAPVGAAQRARLEEAGLTLLTPLGNNAWFASVTQISERLNADAIAADPSLYSVREVRRELRRTRNGVRNQAWNLP